MVSNVKKRTQVERRQNAEQKLFEAAVHLAAEHGYNGFSLAQVGKLAGFSRGLPAHYFGSKENFQRQLIKFIITEFEKSQPTLDDNKGLASLAKSIGRAIEMSDKDAIFIRILLTVLSDKSGSFEPFKELAQYRQQTINKLERDIALGIKDGSIQASVNPKMMSIILIETVCSVIKMALSDPKIDMKIVGTELTQLIFRGISTS